MGESIYVLKTKRYFFVNYCYIIADKRYRSAFLIDPSWQKDIINNVLLEENLHLSAVLLTHSHPDHVDLAAWYAEKYNIPVYISRIEAENSFFSCSNLQLFDDGDIISDGEINIECLITPGHTKGSSCFLSQKGLFTGDTVFIEGCGMCMSYTDGLNDMFQSLQRLKRDIPPTTFVYPGHCYGEQPGKIFQSVCENNVYFQFNTLEQFIRFRTRKGQRGLFNFI